jgi:hypothetical protein
MRPEGRFVVDPAGARTFQRHEVFDAGQPIPNTVDGFKVIRVSTYDLRVEVIDDVLEIFREEPIIYRNQYRADLRDCVVSLQMRVCIRGDAGDPIALSHAEGLQRRPPAIAAIQELSVGQAQISVGDRFPFGAERRARRANSMGSRGFQ